MIKGEIYLVFGKQEKANRVFQLSKRFEKVGDTDFMICEKATID